MLQKSVLGVFVALFFVLPSFASAKDVDLTEVRGVSLPSFEWACVQYDQVYDFPLEETVQVLQNWNLDTVRLPLNQGCWLDNENYRAEVDEVINAFAAAGFGVIIDLHWNAPTGAGSIEQQVMADAERSLDFWRKIATKYKNTEAVIGYELYNEPHSISWDCWKNGCTTSEGWRTVGMQQMVNTVRAIDNETWVIVNGLDWANNVIGAIENRPNDPAGKMAFGWHVYDEFDDPNKCVTLECFENRIAPLADDFDIVITEFGSRLFCNPDHDDMIMNFASKEGIGLVAWAWYPADCGFPALIKDWSGTPSEAGSRWCAFLEGDCYKGVVRGATTTVTPQEPVATESTTPSTQSQPGAGAVINSGQPVCIVSLKHGVLNSQNTLCTSGQTLEISGASDQTWNNRISSWSTDGDWFAIAGWDYYTTSGRVEKGIEVWTPQASENVSESVNDRVRYILMFPGKNGSLTVYENIDKDGPYLKLSLKN